MGAMISRAVQSNSEEDAREASARIVRGETSSIEGFRQLLDAQVIIAGGDDMMFRVPSEKLSQDSLSTVRGTYTQVTNGGTLTMGIGPTMAKSQQALVVGKHAGKNRVEVYGERTEARYQQILKHAAAYADSLGSENPDTYPEEQMESLLRRASTMFEGGAAILGMFDPVKDKHPGNFPSPTLTREQKSAFQTRADAEKRSASDMEKVAQTTTDSRTAERATQKAKASRKKAHSSLDRLTAGTPPGGFAL
jgi:hypothetical protein